MIGSRRLRRVAGRLPLRTRGALEVRAPRAPMWATAEPVRRREGGQVLVLFTLSLVVILLCAALVVDIGLLRTDRQQLNNALDSASLAAGTMLPVDGCNSAQSATTPCGSINAAPSAQVANLVLNTMQVGYPGINATDYTISYRCQIGVDGSSPPQPYVSRDVPSVCNPRNALGHTPTAADFQGTGETRFSACDPALGDKCNVVFLMGSTTTRFSFARVIGLESGTNNNVTSAACNGPCGAPTSAPVDLVIIIDRTGSMSSADQTKTRDAANAILGIYDPTLHRVALGLLGPSRQDTTCAGPGGPAVKANILSGAVNPPPFGTAWPPSPPLGQGSNSAGGGLALTLSAPASVAAGDLLIAGISLTGSTSLINTAQVPAGWTLIAPQDNSTVLGMASYWKIATASDVSASYLWRFTSSVRAVGGIMRFTGADTTNPIDVADGVPGSDTSSPFNVIAPSVTTTTAQTTLIGMYAISAGTTFTNSGLTERIDVPHASGANLTMEFATRTQGAAGSTGTSTAVASAGGNYVAQTIAIRSGNAYGTAYPADLQKWIPVGFTGTDNKTPAPTWNEAYSNAAGVLNANTHITSAVACFGENYTGTNLTTPITMAANYLKNFGRQHVKWGILLETDGQPYDPDVSGGGSGANSDYSCAGANAAATAAKSGSFANADGVPIEIYTVGFGLDGSNDVNCPDSSGAFQGKKVTYLLSQMASSNLAPSPNGTTSGCIPSENTDADHFFCEPKTSDLVNTFSTVATQFAGIRTHLVQLYPPPVVNSVSPAAGAPAGGNTITLTGKYFTNTLSVKFGNTNAAFTVVSDTTMTVVVPAGVSGSTVHIQVTNGGGPSILISADQYHYN